MTKERRTDIEVWMENARRCHQAEKDAEKLKEAEKWYKKVLNHVPQHADALQGLGILANQFGLREQAVAYIQRAIDVIPSPAYYKNLGHVLYQAGRYAEAVDVYTKTLELLPNYTDAVFSRGNAYFSMGRLTEAAEDFRRTVQLDPNKESGWLNLGGVCKDLGFPIESRQALDQCYRITQNDGLLVRKALVTAPVWQSRDHMETEWQRLEEEFEALGSWDLIIKDPYLSIGSTLFYSAYTDKLTRPLHEKMAYALRSLHETKRLKTREAGRKLRIGFISRFFSNHSVAYATNGIISGLAAQDKFTICLFAFKAQEENTHPSWVSVRDSCSEVTYLPENVEKASDLVHAADLDILIYADIGMDPMTFLMAFKRLAPIQAVLPGHPDTTGIPTIDYFLSSAMAESEEAEAFYSEKLVRFRGLPTAYSRPPDPPPASRSDLGLPDNYLFFCPMKLQKIHPDLDQAFAQILLENPDYRLLICRDLQRPWHRTIQERWATNDMKTVEHQVIWSDWLPRERFMQVLRSVDVVLDSWYFGGANTAYQSFAMGTPVVTWPGQYLRGRGVLICYDAMRNMTGFDFHHWCVAASPDDYVRKATEIPLKPLLRDKIQRASAALFNDTRMISDFITWAESLRDDIQNSCVDTQSTPGVEDSTVPETVGRE